MFRLGLAPQTAMGEGEARRTPCVETQGRMSARCSGVATAWGLWEAGEAGREQITKGFYGFC